MSISYPLILFERKVLIMSFADFEDIYRICTNFNEEDGHSIDIIRLEINLTPGTMGTDIPLTSPDRWWELAEKEIHLEKGENVLI